MTPRRFALLKKALLAAALVSTVVAHAATGDAGIVVFYQSPCDTQTALFLGDAVLLPATLAGQQPRAAGTTLGLAHVLPH